MMKVPTRFAFVSAALLSASVFAAEVVTKEATGEAAIVEGNRSRAEKEAKDIALREAVEQVVGVMISAETLTSNSQLISDRIFSNSAGYIRKYDIVSKREEGGVMKVTVKAEVGTAALDKDLQAVKALIRRFGNRKLVILMQEQAVDPKGVITSSGVMSTVLTEAFKADGWTIVDPHFAAGKMKLSSGVALGAVEAKEIGDLAKADYILYGNVNFKYHGASGPYDFDGKGQQIQFNVTGEYDLGAFATDSGSQLAKFSGKFNTGDVGRTGTNTVSYERTAFDISKNKGAKVVEEARKAVLEYLRNAEQNGNRLVMHVTGLSEYAEVQGFKKTLSASVNGVREVRPGSFGSGKAQFDVMFVGTSDDLAERVGGKKFQGKRISVTGVTGNTIEVKLAK